MIYHGWWLLICQSISQPSSISVGTGTIEGGWEYIWASYCITWLGFLIYGIATFLKKPDVKN